MSFAITCESCGRPMGSKEEHGAQNPDNPYCTHCTDMNGKLLPFEKKFEEFVEVAVSGRGLVRGEAARVALAQMAEMPAWRERLRQAASSRS